MPVAARLLAVAGAVLMPVSLFLDWYTVDTGDTTFSSQGWDVFETTDAFMLLAGIAVLALIVTRSPNVARMLMIVGAFMTGLIAVQLIDRPGILGFADGPGLTIEVGAWLGLLGAALVLVAGAVASLGHRAPIR